MIRNKILYRKLSEKLYLVKNRLNKEVKEMPKERITEEILELLALFESKTYISSNLDDLIWFYNNGLSTCKKVIDFGTGGGYLAFLISSMVDGVVGYEYEGEWVDQKFNPKTNLKAFLFFYEVINKINSKIKFKLYNSLPLKEPAESYDGIILYAVIEHIDRKIQKKVLREIYRILKKDGFLFIAKLPRLFSYQELIAKVAGFQGHSNLYSRAEINRLLQTSGFKIIKMDKTGLFINNANIITNSVFSLTRVLENLRVLPPFSFILHDYRIIAKKN